jgi:hypothetical protein
MEAWGPDGSVRLMMADKTSRPFSLEEPKNSETEHFWHSRVGSRSLPILTNRSGSERNSRGGSSGSSAPDSVVGPAGGLQENSCSAEGTRGPIPTWHRHALGASYGHIDNYRLIR